MRGYTLVEVAVVVLVLGILAAVVPPSLPDLASDESTAVQEVRTLLSSARRLSAETGRTVVLDIGGDGTFQVLALSDTLQISDQRTISLDRASLKVVREGSVTDASELSVEPVGPWTSFWFRPTGQAWGPELDINDGSGSNIVIGVDWPSGRPVVRH